MTQSPISLMPYTDGDAADLYEAIHESLAELSPWMPWAHPGYTLDQMREWIATQKELAQQGLAYDFSMRDEKGRYLGGCGLNQINKANRFANLGYWVRTSAMGHGVAAQAVALVADYAFKHTDLVRLEIVCAVLNTRSQRVAEKAGAVREGVLRNRLLLAGGPVDAALYSLVR